MKLGLVSDYSHCKSPGVQSPLSSPGSQPQTHKYNSFVTIGVIVYNKNFCNYRFTNSAAFQSDAIGLSKFNENLQSPGSQVLRFIEATEWQVEDCW